MKWSSSSNSSLSNGSIVTMAVNNSNNNNSSISSSGSNTSSNSGIIRSAVTVRRHESDRRSIFYTDPQDMEIFLKNHNNNKKVCWIIQFLIFSSHNRFTWWMFYTIDLKMSPIPSLVSSNVQWKTWTFIQTLFCRCDFSTHYDFDFEHISFIFSSCAVTENIWHESDNEFCNLCAVHNV